MIPRSFLTVCLREIHHLHAWHALMLLVLLVWVWVLLLLLLVRLWHMRASTSNDSAANNAGHASAHVTTRLAGALALRGREQVVGIGERARWDAACAKSAQKRRFGLFFQLPRGVQAFR